MSHISAHNLHNLPVGNEGSHVHRIGSVSRLSGVPVSTLRMWESRYAAFVPGKTGGLHRLYAEADVVKARVLRELTNAGQSIGRIAQLPLAQLQGMLTDARIALPDPARPKALARLSAVVVGSALGARLQSPGWQRQLAGVLLDVRAVFMSIDEAETEEGRALLRESDILVARVNALQADTVENLCRLKATSPIRSAVLLYNFAPALALAALRDAGFLLRREPIDDNELADLLRSGTWAQAQHEAPAEKPGTTAAAIPHRRYEEAELARIAAAPARMLCECPRHLVDIVMQLASFEEYSMQCLNDSEEDARVHAQLRSVAGSARALFEDALELVLAHEARNTARV